jgi:rubrerythrin
VLQERSGDSGKLKVWQDHSVNNDFSKKDIKDEEREKGRRLTTMEVYTMHRKKGVCKRCESICYRDGSGYRCPRCGWTGQTISAEEYRERGYYR